MHSGDDDDDKSGNFRQEDEREIDEPQTEREAERV